MNDWASTTDVAEAVREASALTDEQLIARMNRLAAGAEREGRINAVVALMLAPQRVLDSTALAEAQRVREERA